jgi:hypothetical protein
MPRVNHQRIALGLLASFLGIIVPVYHHVSLHGAIAHERSSNDISRMTSVWDYLPWVDWAYLAFMWLVGAVLIVPELVRGMLNRSPARERPAARGFEVITDKPSEGGTP